MTEDKRKLNDVFTVPRSRGCITIKGIIGSGKTREEVTLKAKSDINSTDVIYWRHHIGEQWKVVEHFTESEQDAVSITPH